MASSETHLTRVPWDRAQEGSGTQGSWVTSQDHPLIQEQCIPTKKIQVEMPEGLKD